ncbi:MAG TPA: DMT family transporter [Aggregatilinea sp.]|jgi:drug/metabolite transporter (DMT)-like permease|uniref:DMT family transporter n=1 Tax=Aggregatilinea sp. TaxID=2806333 RepID=UPI002BCBE41D|nr:DMT family transporter [Aggregatilinea sp.]HML22027.1 DMT family transporter [Aggregatilinea sp.]
MGEYIGELAALGTSVCWSFTSILFSVSGQKVGSPVVNRTRLLLAVIMVSLLHWVLEGSLLPIHAESWRWGWMALSGLIGFVLGDACLFQAFVMIGPRLSMLLMALSPVMGAFMGWVLLGESLAAGQIAGIALAMAGVAWVVADRTNAPAAAPSTPPRHFLLGVLLGLGGALGQAGGLVASKEGLQGDFPALSGNLMRLVVSTLAIWLIAAATGKVRSNFSTLRAQPGAMLTILGGSIAGPLLGVWLSLIAVQNAEVGIASTLTSLSPIFLLPLTYVLFRERITSRAIVGTLLAVVGTAIIFLS